MNDRAFTPCPRPENITDRELAQWTAEFEAAQAIGEAGASQADEVFKVLFPKWQHSPASEVWLCGQWLHRELIEAGCELNLASRITFATAQRIAAQVDPDPWAVTTLALSEYKQGRYEEPGEDLAIRLMTGQFPALVRRFGRPSPEAMARAKRLTEGMQMPPSPF